MRSGYGYLEFLDVVKERRKPSPRLGDSAELMSFIVKANTHSQRIEPGHTIDARVYMAVECVGWYTPRRPPLGS
jgi:hypothetical protein